jgi:hypothetical protein
MLAELLVQYEKYPFEVHLVSQKRLAVMSHRDFFRRQEDRRPTRTPNAWPSMHQASAPH